MITMIVRMGKLDFMSLLTVAVVTCDFYGIVSRTSRSCTANLQHSKAYCTHTTQSQIESWYLIRVCFYLHFLWCS